MAKFVLENGDLLAIDSDRAIDDHTFEVVLQTLSSRTVEEMMDVSFRLRRDFQKCRKVLDLALSRASFSPNPSKNALVEPYSKENIQIYILGLMIQHNMDSRDLMEDLQHVSDKRLDMLRGFALLNLKQYDDAEFYFDKIGYRRGVEICKLFKKDKNAALMSLDPVILCYADSSNWKRIEADTKNRDFLFRIGQSSTYQNEENLDVQLTLIDQDILKASTSTKDRIKLLEGPLEKLRSLCDQGFVSAEVVYMIGKTYHLMQNYVLAADEYRRALNLDREYLPAKFNLARIMGEPMNSDAKDPSVCDYNALLSLKHSRFDADLHHCSDLIRKLGWTITQSRAMDKSALDGLESLREYVDGDALDNNAAIILNDSSSVESLQSLLKRCNPSIRDYVFYNLSVLKQDVQMLEESPLPEARMHIDLLTRNVHTSDDRLRAYLTLSKDLVKDKDDVFSRILYGCVSIHEFQTQNTLSSLDEAENAFMSASHSMYCVNGLGVCAALRGHYEAAIKLFQQITEEYDGAHQNLGNAYFLKEDYEKALSSYLKALDSENTVLPNHVLSRGILRFLAHATRDIKAIERLAEAGVEGLENLRVRVLLEMGEIQKVKEMNPEDPDVIEQLNICIGKEEGRKRKIAELEEYRKKRSIN